jgi:hypothetical protein
MPREQDRDQAGRARARAFLRLHDTIVAESYTESDEWEPDYARDDNGAPDPVERLRQIRADTRMARLGGAPFADKWAPAIEAARNAAAEDGVSVTVEQMQHAFRMELLELLREEHKRCL